MEFKKKTIIWEDNNQPPKDKIWAKNDGKFYEFDINTKCWIPSPLFESKGSTPSEGTLNGHEYVDLGLPSETLWATTNVGATTPQGSGMYFSWGEVELKCNNYNWSSYKYGPRDGITKYGDADNLTKLTPEDDAATVHWGEGWVTPTKDQLEELTELCTWEWDTTKKGWIVTGLNQNTIFLPAAGGWTPNFGGVGTSGGYLSSELDKNSDYNSSGNYTEAYSLTFSGYMWSRLSYSRAEGHSIRPVVKK